MIEKITDQNLERYDSRLKEWCDRKFFEKGNYGKYQTTEETGAVAFYPAPNTPLEGKVKFSFKETMPISGDKGPDNPSTINGVSIINVYHAGKNLMPPNTAWQNHSWGDEVNGITATKISDAVIEINGTSSADTYINLVPKINIPTGTTCTLSGAKAGAGNSIYRIACYNASSSSPKDLGSGVTWIQESFSAGVMPAINIKPNYKAENLEFRIQIELGDTKTEFEAPVLTTYTIPLSNTYYGGSIDLITGIMTVTHCSIILDSVVASVFGYGVSRDSSNQIYARQIAVRLNGTVSGFPQAVISGYNSSDIPLMTHFKNTNRWDGTIAFMLLGLPDQWFGISDDTGVFFSDSRTGAENVQYFFNWCDAQKIAGTPVTLCYKLQTPQVIQLSPVQILTLTQTDKYIPRLNTVYTDADSVQISYLKSPIRDEYEKTQAILSLGGNS